MFNIQHIAKGVIRIGKSMDRQHNGQTEKDKGKKTIYKQYT